MIALLLLSVFLLLAASIGRPILSLLHTVPASRLDRLVTSTALGLGVIAYLILAVGLLGWLTRVPVIIGMVALLLVSWRGLLETLLDLQPRIRKPVADLSSVGEREDGTLLGGEDADEWASDAGPAEPPIRDRPSQKERGGPPLLALATAIILGAVGVIVLIDCFVPPAVHEWDALAYHLAVPKVYLANHRILFLPTDTHSNFPFLVEMLFTVGLLFEGYALANLFHFALGALTVGAILMVGRRHFSSRAGMIGALVFATTPIMIWEAGAAYVELGMTLFVLLSVGFALEYRVSREPRWLALAGVAMGFALSVKALALVPFVLLTVLLVLTGCRFTTVRWYFLSAVLVGCPFYLKSAVMTGNPVYPFAYRLFGGKYWNTELADAYAGTQRAFGLHQHLLSAADDVKNVRPDDTTPGLKKVRTAWLSIVYQRVRNILVAPFAQISVPRIFYDYFDPGMFTHLGFLFLGLAPLAYLMGAASPAARWTGGIALAWFLVWSQTMQYVRYLIPLLPLLALIGGEGAERLVQRQPAFRMLVGAVIVCQAALALWYFGTDVIVHNPTGRQTQPMPGQWDLACDPEARETYLTRTVNCYEAEQWINRYTSDRDGVVLFEEVRGFYLDRPYLWGNGFHSSYIPYADFKNGGQMVDWFLDHRVHYALVNLQFTQEAATEAGREELGPAVASQSVEPLFRRWYDPNRPGPRPEAFRRLLGDAVYSGRAMFIHQASVRGVVALEFRPAERQAGATGTGGR